MTQTDRTTESLLSRRALAEKATPGPWEVDKSEITSAVYVETSWGHLICDSSDHGDAAHIAVSDPATVMADIAEILRLRAEVEFWRQETQDVRENFARTLQCERDKTDRLEREADWLAEYCWKKPEAEYHPLREMRGGFYCGACPHDHDCRKCWREAARKAVETS